MPDSSRHRGFPLAAVILILLGIIFLLNNLGWLPWGLWGSLWRLWPLILVIIGLNIVLGRSHPWLAAVISVLIVVVAVAISAYYGGVYSGQNKVSSFAEPLDSATSVQVEGSFGAGELHIDVLPATSDKLAEGEAGQPNGRLSANVTRQVSRAVLKVEGNPRGWWSAGGGTWWLHLTPRIPIDLTVKTGASNADLDLSQLRIGKLRVDAGASNVNITLPERAGTTEATIKVGAANVDITVPQGVAARVKAQTGLGSFSIDQGRFPKSGDYFVSPDYNTAANRVNIDVSSGVASVHVR